MIFARNSVTVKPAYPALDSDGSYQLGEGKYAVRLTVQVFVTNVIVQPSEVFPVVFGDPGETEIELVIGFHTLEPVTPFTGFRFRSKLPASVPIINLRAYS